MKREKKEKLSNNIQVGVLSKQSLIKDKVFLSLFRGIIVFFGVYGSIGTYLSGFSISYDRSVVIIILAIISFYMGFVYYNKWTENIGYLLLLAMFAVSAIWMKAYLESGFAALLNDTIQILSQTYDLPAVRMFLENVEDRYTSITVCIIFLGIFMEIICNIIIARFMSFYGMMFMMMPFVGTVFFFERTVNKKYIFMDMLALLIIIVLRQGENYKNKKSWFRYLNLKKKKTDIVKFRIQSGITLLQIGVWLSLLMVLFWGIMSTFDMKKEFKITTDLKEQSNDTIRTILMVGLPAYLAGDYGGGGVSGGNLKGVASVNPDYEVDLKVTFVPYTTDSIYLKAFEGLNYTGKKWTSYVEGEYPFLDISSEKMRNKESSILEKAYEKQKNNNALKTKMRIENMSANDMFTYFPYYSYIKESNRIIFGENDRVVGSFYIGDSYTLTYYPYVEQIEAEGEDKTLEERYAKYVTEHYLQIPEKNKQVLVSICASIGREGTEEEKIERVVNYLTQEYSYSKKPGAVPKGEDFVNYFLEKRKKGFCMHFASAATLLLREMGIPSRYIEGYVIPYSYVMDGEILENENYDNWMQGKNPLGKTAVVQVDVDDSLAHAWVEVYQKGFGWRKVEVTPADYGEDQDEENFWSNLSNALKLENKNEATKQAGVSGIAVAVKIAAKILIILLCITVISWCSYRLIWKIFFQKIKSYYQKKRNGYNQNIAIKYDTFCKTLAYFINDEEVAFKEPKEVLEIFEKQCETLQIKNYDSNLQEVARMIEKALYSPHMLSEEEYERCSVVLVEWMKNYKKQQGIWKRMKNVFHV